MNLREFVEAADQITRDMEENALRCFIHNIARKTSVGKRSEFLKLLNNIRENSQVSSEEKQLQKAVRKLEAQEIQQEMNRLRCLFQQIADEEIFITAEGYEDYSQGYGLDNWIWEYQDTHDICCMYRDSSSLVIHCVNNRFYAEAVEIFDMIMDTEIFVENDYDNFSMGLEELTQEGVITTNLESLALHVLYATYQLEKPTMRARKIFDYFSISFFRNIHIEDMLSLGVEELTGLADFWKLWIELLVSKKGDVAGRLLRETILYEKGR